MIAAVAAAAALAVRSAVRPSVSLVASPARIELVGSTGRTVRVTNTGSRPVVVDVGQAGFALDLRGRPRVVGPHGPVGAGWLAVRPRRLMLAAGAGRTVTVAASLPRGAAPGDHTALVLVTTRPSAGSALAVRMRLGIVVSVRVPGRVVHRLVIAGVRLVRRPHGSAVEVSLANRGNVTESVDARRFTVVLRRQGRVVATLRPVARELLPRSHGIVEARFRGRLRGGVTAVVRVTGAGGVPAIVRRSRLGPWQ